MAIGFQRGSLALCPTLDLGDVDISPTQTPLALPFQHTLGLNEKGGTEVAVFDKSIFMPRAPCPSGQLTRAAPGLMLPARAL